MTGFSQPERRGLERTQLGAPSSPSFGEGGNGTVHPDADLLTAFAEHSLTTREHDQLLAHLAACAACREVIALAGSPLVEPVSEPARKRGLWEMPLFHWGAVAATTVVVVAAVMLSVRQQSLHKMAPTTTAIQNEQLPSAVAQEDQVVAEPRAKAQVSSGLDINAPAASASPAPKRALHVQQEARYERANPVTAKKQEVASATNNGPVHGNIASGGPATNTNTRDYLYSANSNAVLKSKAADLSPAPAAAPPPPPPPPVTQNVTVGGASEMVTVEAEKVEAKDQRASATVEVSPQSVISDEKISSYSAGAMQKAARVGPGRRWQMGSDGKLQRSAGSSVWQTVLPAQTFRTFAVIQNHVWAGGDNGLLYHSADNGQTWTPISVKSGTTALTGNISSLRFTGAQNGSLTSSTGETWTTNDGGQSWQKK